MRLSFYILGILILANVTVYFWPDKLNTGAKLYAAKEDVKPHFLRLNKEIEDKYYAKKRADALVANSSFTPPVQGDGASLSVNTSEPVKSKLVTEDGNVCYRLGPFLHAANYELAQAVLLNADIDYKKTKRVAKESDVYRVYLGPFPDPAVLVDTRTELNRKKIFDHFVRKEPDGKLIISLGIYSNVDKAASAVKLFEGRLDKVNQRNETITLPDSYWLHFALATTDPVRAQLSQTDWGERSAKVGRYQCIS